MQPTHAPPCCSCCPLPTVPQIELIAKAAGGAAGGGAGGPRTLSSGIRISGEKGGTRMVQLTRHFQQVRAGWLAGQTCWRARTARWLLPQLRLAGGGLHLQTIRSCWSQLQPTVLACLQAAGGTGRVRGRGSVRSGRSGVAAMQE